MSRPALVLGLDGGGTHTRALAASPDGAVRGEGAGGPCSVSAMSPPDALLSATTAAQSALAQAGADASQVRAVCAGVAGASVETRRAALETALSQLFPQAKVAVVPDFAVALAGATGGRPGMIVIAGTGSVAYGDNGRGRVHRTGAYGYLIDDAGSGYGVGRAALAAVLRGADGGGARADALTARVLAALGLGSVAEIVPHVYGGSIDRVAIASLARTVAQSADEDGDPQAQAILMRAGGALALLAQGVASAAFADGESAFSLVPIGGLWGAGAALTDVFWRSVARFAPHAVPTAALHPPVYGAVLRAASLLEPERAQVLRER